MAAILQCTTASAEISWPPEPTDTSYVFEIDPDREFFPNFGISFSIQGPYEGAEITNTTFDLTFVSDGTTPASDLSMKLGLELTQQGYTEVAFTGADLGFGSGANTFTATFSTDALNGVVAGGPFFPYAFTELSVFGVNGSILGDFYFIDSSFTFDLIPAVPAPGSAFVLTCSAIAIRRTRRA